MDNNKNTIIGFGLIAVLMMAWIWMMQPSKAELARKQHTQDSLRFEQRKADSLKAIDLQNQTKQAESVAQQPDSVKAALFAAQFGAFAPSAAGKNEDVVLENDVLRLTLSTKGGRIKSAELKKYLGYAHDSTGAPTGAKVPVKLLEDANNKFEYILPVAGLQEGLSTEKLYFTMVSNDGKTAILQAKTANGGYFEQRYTIADNYVVDYEVSMSGLENVLWRGANNITLNWENYLTAVEKSQTTERTLSTVYYKAAEASTNYCSCTTGDEANIDKQVKWVANTQQFFTSALIADYTFDNAHVATEMLKDQPNHLKKLYSQILLPLKHQAGENFGMTFYLGPNDHPTLVAMNQNLENVIPYGRSFFGAINRWMVRPLFNFLSSFIGSLGLCIILLTLLIKLALYPLQHKMILSSVKMQVLRPQLAELKKRTGDDQQKYATEQMKLYSEYGVSPLGGCLPALLQTPIWIALYRFFPASLPFRQVGFLWADDLVSYDSVFEMAGYHFSLFTILWLISMIAFAWYNGKLMDPMMQQQNPAMKYLPYIFPFFFFFVLNGSASGLTCYMMCSNVLNIALTLFIKNVVIDEEKVRLQLEKNKSEPKKKSSFQQRLDEAMKQAQAQQEAKKKK